MSRYGSSNYGPGQGPPDISGMHTLKVDNISYRCGVEELRRLFDRYGDIGDVYIPRDIRTNESRGFGFVRFFDRRDAEDAMDAMDREVVDGRELRVQFAERDRPRNPRQYFTDRYSGPPPRSRGGRYDDYGYDNRRRGGGRYDDYDSYDRRRRSRSGSRNRSRRSRSRSRSPKRSYTPSRSRSRSRSASHSRSPSVRRGGYSRSRSN
mmetsp:Transcript_41263/g.54264  ORF Transcript_41263/g.54264 Transcript_41263/m.54264 type:complete len:207 (+) Transcript_41263:181-801(+)